MVEEEPAKYVLFLGYIWSSRGGVYGSPLLDCFECNVVAVYRCFRGASCFLQGYLSDDAGSKCSETSLNFYQTLRRKKSEDIF
jgi:hypothetical protein